MGWPITNGALQRSVLRTQPPGGSVLPPDDAVAELTDEDLFAPITIKFGLPTLWGVLSWILRGRNLGSGPRLPGARGPGRHSERRGNQIQFWGPDR